MRKNILILSHNDATQFVDICNQYTQIFDKSQFKVTVAYLSGAPSEETRQRTTAEEVIFLNCSKKSISGLKLSAIKKLTKLCRERNFSIAIGHRYKACYVLLWAAKACNIPAVFFVMHAMNTMKNLGRKILFACFALKNMYFAGVSNAVRDDIQRDVWGIPKERVITLYNCIDTEFTEAELLDKASARKFLGLPQDAFVFGTIGRLAPDKDQKTLISAFAQIQPSLPNAKLVIMGDGALESDLKQQIQTLNLADQVILSGFVPQAFRYIKALDIFTLPSTVEPFGRVLIEAMTAKVPLIATRVDGIPEVVGDSGIIVDPGKPDQLASAMLDLATKKPQELISQGDNGYERVMTYFSLECFQKAFFSIPVVKNLA